MSDPQRPAPEAEPATRPTVGIYDAPERRPSVLPMALIFIVILIALAVVVIWLF